MVRDALAAPIHPLGRPQSPLERTPIFVSAHILFILHLNISLYIAKHYRRRTCSSTATAAALNGTVRKFCRWDKIPRSQDTPCVGRAVLGTCGVAYNRRRQCHPFCLFAGKALNLFQSTWQQLFDLCYTETPTERPYSIDDTRHSAPLSGRIGAILHDFTHFDNHQIILELNKIVKAPPIKQITRQHAAKKQLRYGSCAI